MFYFITKLNGKVNIKGGEGRFKFVFKSVNQ